MIFLTRALLLYTDEISLTVPVQPAVAKTDTVADTNTKLSDVPKNIDESSVSNEASSNGPAKDLTEKAGQDFDPAKEFTEILSFAPVVIFSKTYCPYSMNLKKMLKNDYDLIPVPVIVELDKHKHGKELQQYIGDTSGRRTVPNLFVNGVSRGGFDDMNALHVSGMLLGDLVEWGGKALKVTKHSAPSNS